MSKSASGDVFQGRGSQLLIASEGGGRTDVLVSGTCEPYGGGCVLSDTQHGAIAAGWDDGLQNLPRMSMGSMGSTRWGSLGNATPGRRGSIIILEASLV
jgi:hypothetical protein